MFATSFFKFFLAITDKQKQSILIANYCYFYLDIINSKKLLRAEKQLILLPLSFLLTYKTWTRLRANLDLLPSIELSFHSEGHKIGAMRQLQVFSLALSVIIHCDDLLCSKYKINDMKASWNLLGKVQIPVVCRYSSEPVCLCQTSLQMMLPSALIHQSKTQYQLESTETWFKTRQANKLRLLQIEC